MSFHDLKSHFFNTKYLFSECITIYLFVAKKVGINFGKGMFIFGLFYLYCLTSMLSTALSMVCLYRFSVTTLVMFFVGAIFFASSDFMLTGAYFKEGQRPKAYMAIYSVFYYLAQFIIAFAICFLYYLFNFLIAIKLLFK